MFGGRWRRGRGSRRGMCRTPSRSVPGGVGDGLVRTRTGDADRRPGGGLGTAPPGGVRRRGGCRRAGVRVDGGGSRRRHLRRATRQLVASVPAPNTTPSTTAWSRAGACSCSISACTWSTSPGRPPPPPYPWRCGPAPASAAWATLAGGLGIPDAPAVGERIEVTAPDAPALAGTVADVDPRWVALILDRPAPGTAFLAVEGDGDHVTVSIWSYLYGPDGAAAAERNDPLWRRWLSERAPGSG